MAEDAGKPAKFVAPAARRLVEAIPGEPRPWHCAIPCAHGSPTPGSPASRMPPNASPRTTAGPLRAAPGLLVCWEIDAWQVAYRGHKTASALQKRPETVRSGRDRHPPCLNSSARATCSGEKTALHRSQAGPGCGGFVARSGDAWRTTSSAKSLARGLTAPLSARSTPGSAASAPSRGSQT